MGGSAPYPGHESEESSTGPPPESVDEALADAVRSAPETPGTTPGTTSGTTVVGDVIRRSGITAWSIVGILILTWIVLWVLGRMEVLLAPIVLAVVLVYVLNPIVSRLHSRRVPRLLGSVIAFLVLIGILVLVGYLVVPSISEQATELAADFPQIYEETMVQVEDLAGGFGFDIDLWSYEEVRDWVNDPENQDQFTSVVLDRLGAVTSGIFEAVLVFFLAPVVAFYLLMDLGRIRDQTVSLLPPSNREEIVFVSRRLGTAVGGFLRGQVLVALIVGVLMSFGFWLIGLDFWLIIGMIGGLLNIVPFVGPWVGGALGVTVGLVTGTVTTAIWAAVVALAVQQIDNNFVSPTVLRATVRLHPAAVVLVLILGGAIGGLWGVLLAVPLTAAIKIVVGHLWRTRVLGQTWDEAAAALIEEPPPAPRLRRRSGESEDPDATVEQEEIVPGAAPPGAGDEAGLED